MFQGLIFIFHRQFNTAVFRLLLKHHINPVQNLRYAERLMGKLHFSAFYSGHVQDIIDQCQKITGRKIYLIQAVSQLVPVVHGTSGNFRHTYNSVHGSTYFMRHGRKKFTFSLARFFRHIQGMLHFSLPMPVNQEQKYQKNETYI